jgi:uncharacterized membrane protein
VPSISFWISPIVQDANLYDFHAITIGTACIVWSSWAFEGNRRIAGWAFLSLALACQEDFALIGGMLAHRTSRWSIH